MQILTKTRVKEFISLTQKLIIPRNSDPHIFNLEILLYLHVDKNKKYKSLEIDDQRGTEPSIHISKGLFVRLIMV